MCFVSEMLVAKREQMREKMRAKREHMTKERGERRKMHGEKAKELKKALKEYSRDNIYPTFKAQRAKLEPNLSRQEQTEIAEIRQKFAEYNNVKMENVIVGNGSEGVLSYIFKAFWLEFVFVYDQFFQAWKRSAKMICIPLPFLTKSKAFHFSTADILRL